MQSFYIWAKYINSKNAIITQANKRFEQVVNVLKNEQLYAQKISQKDDTLSLVIQKVLDNVVIIDTQKNKEIASSFDIKNIDKNMIIWPDLYSVFNYEKYKIYVKTRVIYSLNDAFKEFWIYILYSILLSFVFYFVWYFFVGRNLRPINKNIIAMHEFIWNINHEFKTPLCEIISTLDLSLMTKDYEWSIKRSIASAKRLDYVLDSLVDFINITQNNFSKQKVNLNSEINIIISELTTLAKEKNVLIIFQKSSTLYLKKVNIAHVHICFLNLIKNAIKYNKTWWKVYIKIDKNSLRIKDTWIWIKKENQDKIFNRFYRETDNSDGSRWIWLALVKRIIDMNWWEITLNSEENVWTEFIVKFC